MRKFLTALLLLVSSMLIAGNLTPQSLTDKQIGDMERLLERIAKEQNNKELMQHLDCDIVAAYYFAASNSIPPKSKLAVGGCLSLKGFYPESLKLIREYVEITPNDWEGQMALGDTLTKTEAYNQAVPVFLTALKLLISSNKTDTLSKALNYSCLAKAAMLGGRSDVLHSIVTNLVEFKSDDYLTKKLSLDAFTDCALYAIGTSNSELFVKAVQAVDQDAVLAYPDSRLSVAIGCQVFSSRDTEKLCRALRDTAEKKIIPSKAIEGIPITPAELKAASELLRAYESGELDLYPMAEDKVGQLLMGYYLAKTNGIANKAKLPISRSFALAGRFEEAIQLADEYVRAVPNDVRGWRIIGLSSYELEKYARACEALTNAVALGETNVCTVLAMCAFESGQAKIVKEIVPQLLQAARFGDNRDAATVALLIYAICSDDQNLFVQALKGALEQGLRAPQIRAMLLVGHLRFQQSPLVQSLWMKYQALLR